MGNEVCHFCVAVTKRKGHKIVIRQFIRIVKDPFLMEAGTDRTILGALNCTGCIAVIFKRGFNLHRDKRHLATAIDPWSFNENEAIAITRYRLTRYGRKCCFDRKATLKNMTLWIILTLNSDVSKLKFNGQGHPDHHIFPANYALNKYLQYRYPLRGSIHVKKCSFFNKMVISHCQMSIKKGVCYRLYQ